MSKSTDEHTLARGLLRRFSPNLTSVMAVRSEKFPVTIHLEIPCNLINDVLLYIQYDVKVSPNINT